MVAIYSICEDILVLLMIICAGYFVFKFIFEGFTLVKCDFCGKHAKSMDTISFDLLQNGVAKEHVICKKCMISAIDFKLKETETDETL
jgi:hypothetical protein